ncbi:MAG: farnesyl diphosphate synthase [Parvibaculaceae bacterium]|jgi:farnesyl diphosphate synthase|nr:polyprenyl synthetase family protein [Parvibaculaceae bacterium]
MSDFEQVLDKSASLVEEQLKRMLPRVEGPEGRLHEAMRYAALAGGKRFRPFLALESASMFGVSEDRALRVAVAIECIHTYSLIHDDLPCMDDDDLRRGQPSTHKAFDEATAVLAGDGLQAFAFEVLAKEETHEDPHIRVELVRQLAHASGPRGMVGGQMIDLASEGKTLDVGALTRLHQLKTGALIAFACDAGAILGRASPASCHALHAYAHDLGLAYQVADDVLDVKGDRETLGKTAGKDEEAGKATFVSVLGLERAHGQAQLLANQAVQHLDIFDGRADRLREAAQFVVNRRA